MSTSNNNQKDTSNEFYTLLSTGLVFTKTALGQAVFIPKGDTDAYNGLLPDKWTTKQLRAIADYMEANPNCTIFNDGSGEPCT